MDKVKAWRDAARDAQENIGSKYATFRTFAVEGVAQYYTPNLPILLVTLAWGSHYCPTTLRPR
jgi:hypothetical protein